MDTNQKERAYPYRKMRGMDTNQKLAVGIREAAQMIGVSTRSVQNYISAKVLPARKIGRRTVILVRSLEAFLRQDHASPLLRSDHADTAQ